MGKFCILIIWKFICYYSDILLVHQRVPQNGMLYVILYIYIYIYIYIYYFHFSCTPYMLPLNNSITCGCLNFLCNRRFLSTTCTIFCYMHIRQKEFTVDRDMCFDAEKTFFNRLLSFMSLYSASLQLQNSGMNVNYFPFLTQFLMQRM